MPETGTIARIGILTGGGDCPGINAVVRAVAKTAINDYEVEVGTDTNIELEFHGNTPI